MGVLHIILKVGHPKIISTQISEQKILMWFVSHNIPKRNKLAEKISQKNPEPFIDLTYHTYLKPTELTQKLISINTKCGIEDNSLSIKLNSNSTGIEYNSFG
jgi:hypothetical protein